MAVDEQDSRGRGEAASRPTLALTPILERALLRAGVTFSGELQIEGLVRRLRSVLPELPGLRRSGLAVRDEERETVTIYDFSSVPGSTGTEAVTVDERLGVDAGGPPLAKTPEAYTSPDLQGAGGDRFDQRLSEAGARRYVSVPLLLQGRLLGFIFLGFESPAPIPGEIQAYLRQLALLVTPILWNCHTQARFTHGDRRRDTLIELSDAINRSLKLETVLDSARQAIRGLESHCFSEIDILEADKRAYGCYANPSVGEPPSRPAGKAELTSVGETAMEWILKHERTYQSEDLETRVRFSHDAALRRRGVRRYVATPMFVRGRIIGCFLMGSSDRRPALGIDVWLYENIALQLALAIDNARQLEQVQKLSDRMAQQNVYLREEIHREHDFSEMVGQSPAMLRVHEAIARVAETDSTVLIQGETGVGKELVARAIHAASARAEHPMVKVNCAAIPEGMVESELFGHERGAFTSAVERRVGRFELARDGTLFLDEVGELFLPVQAKLLRVLQDGKFERVGGARTLASNARIIASTNRDLLKCVQERSFRSDLYYRLNVFLLEVPPLRTRREDIPLLVEAFISQFNRRMGKRVQSIDPAAMVCLCRRNWPGNIRELQHQIERAMILCDGPVLRIPCQAGEVEVAPPPEPASADAAVPTLADMEADHIRRALVATGGVIEGPHGAARLLGLKPSTLRFRMKRLGLSRPD